jgi:hypothetical protein
MLRFLKKGRDKKMDALLVLDNNNVSNLRVLVTVTKKELKDQVIELLERNCGKEAFNLLRSKAEVKAYLPRGSKLAVRPEVILIEDML